jgi:hypothetical protein
MHARLRRLSVYPLLLCLHLVELSAEERKPAMRPISDDPSTTGKIPHWSGPFEDLLPEALNLRR